MMLKNLKKLFFKVFIFFLFCFLWKGRVLALEQYFKTIFIIPEVKVLEDNNDCVLDGVEENSQSITLFKKGDFDKLADYTDKSLPSQKSILLGNRQTSGDLARVNFLFKRYIYGLIIKDVKLILSVTADNISFPLYAQSMHKKSQYEFFSELFATFEFNKVSIESLYCLDSKTLFKISKDRILVSLVAKKKSPYVLKHWHYWDDFWGLKHYYFFERVSKSWKLIAFDIDYNKELL